jgi:hypothetical protein
MTPAYAGLDPVEPPSEGQTDQEGKQEQRCEKVVHPVLWGLRRIPQENGRKRQCGADAEQRRHAPRRMCTLANEIGHKQETPGHPQVVLPIPRRLHDGPDVPGRHRQANNYEQPVDRGGQAGDPARAVLDAAIASGRKRLWSTVGVWNTPSLRVLEKRRREIRQLDPVDHEAAQRPG